MKDKPITKIREALKSIAEVVALAWPLIAYFEYVTR